MYHPPPRHGSFHFLQPSFILSNGDDSFVTRWRADAVEVDFPFGACTPNGSYRVGGVGELFGERSDPLLRLLAPRWSV